MVGARTWDIFCHVVDNYGDAGVCWRLARQLASEHGRTVRLWMDRPEALARIWPPIEAGRPAQSCQGVEVRRWSEPWAEATVGDVVVEAFACTLPDACLEAMATRTPPPRWINLEYLSAEGWVRECHGLASPSPRLALTKHFFFPGFVPGTGGLLLERGLLGRRRAFQQDGAAQQDFWRTLDLPMPAAGELRVSLFCYENGALPELLAAWAGQPGPVTCLVPEGVVPARLAAFFGGEAPAAGAVRREGRLTVRVLPFLDQDRYDRLLWACDCNFVRGEDSFVRAQWAGRPFVWHIYPQEEGAHWHKLESFLALYGAGLEAGAASALRALWGAWNRGAGAGAAWEGFWQHRVALAQHAEGWVGRQLQNGDLAAKLVTFCESRL
jgi:uncharacterized repeat protein (TIGR03837 family)